VITPLLLLPLALPQDPAARLEAWAARQEAHAAAPHRDLSWRAIGPRMCGGRIEAVDCPPGSPGVIYCGVGAGGVWKSVNGGLDWSALFADQPTFAIGDVEVSRADPEVVWIGTGEAHLSGTSYEGLGVYRSTDGGETWVHAGLTRSAHIGKVAAHPTEVDTAFVAAIGPRGREGERGVYRTTDGGESWTRVLDAGVPCIDLVMDPSNPDRLWATSWDRGRRTRSGVWRTTDGGDTWARLTEGLPAEQVGRVAVDVARSNPDVVYALLVDHSPPGNGRYDVAGRVYRSPDGGDTWALAHEGKLPTYVGWDFCDVRVAPDDPDQVFVCGFELLISDDAGVTWRHDGGAVHRVNPHAGEGMHVDMHDLWIDPERPDRLLLGTDGGLYVSFDRGESYLHLNDLPITEFYKLGIVGDEVWGGTQDNASLVTGSLDAIAPRSEDAWSHVWLDRWWGGDGFTTLPDPFDATVVYWTQQQGDLRRARRGELRRSRRIRPRGEDERWSWDTPLVVSPHTEGLLYCASQHVFRSTDRGDGWDRLPLEAWGGGILSMAESALEPARLVTGAGRGCVQVSADSGKSWTRAAELPSATVREVVTSAHEPERVYVVQSSSARGGEWSVRVHRSDDFGASWTSVAGNLPPEPCNALAEDPRDPDVLYLGTDIGVWATKDSGATWFPLGSDLPTCAVMDLAVHEGSSTLVVVTHGLSAFAVDVGPVAD